jgi:hypothetical protein
LRLNARVSAGSSRKPHNRGVNTATTGTKMRLRMDFWAIAYRRFFLIAAFAAAFAAAALQPDGNGAKGAQAAAQRSLGSSASSLAILPSTPPAIDSRCGKAVGCAGSDERS